MKVIKSFFKWYFEQYAKTIEPMAKYGVPTFM